MICGSNTTIICFPLLLLFTTGVMVPTIECPQGDHKDDIPDTSASNAQAASNKALADTMLPRLPTSTPTAHQPKITFASSDGECVSSLHPYEFVLVGICVYDY